MIRFLSILLLAFALLQASSCAKTEADKVKKVITDFQEAVEEKALRSALEKVSRSYRDPRGNDFDGIKGILSYYVFRHQRIAVYIPGIDVVLEEGSARALFQAVLSGGAKVESPGDLLPEALGVYQFEVTLAKEEGEWKIISAKWERTGASVSP